MKPWYQSKTIIFNVLIIVVAVLTAIVSHPDSFGPEVVGYAAVALSLVNIGLRTITDKGVFWSDPVDIDHYVTEAEEWANDGDSTK